MYNARNDYAVTRAIPLCRFSATVKRGEIDHRDDAMLYELVFLNEAYFVW